MKTLYEVEIEGHVYVMAETAIEANQIAKYNTEKEDLDCNAFEATGSSVWSGWGDSEPYNSDDSRTVREILEEQEKERKRIEQENSHPQLPFGLDKAPCLKST